MPKRETDKMKAKRILIECLTAVKIWALSHMMPLARGIPEFSN